MRQRIVFSAIVCLLFSVLLFSPPDSIAQEKEQETIDKARYIARSEFLELRLKWATEELAELKGKQGKRQLKKKKRRTSGPLYSRLEHAPASSGFSYQKACPE